MHRHGDHLPALLLLLRGRKHVVHFQTDAASKLYPIDLEHTTEFGDELYLADAIRPNLAKQPLLEKARGFEAILEPGDMILLPDGIHQVENLEESLSVTFGHEAVTDPALVNQKDRPILDVYQECLDLCIPGTKDDLALKLFQSKLGLEYSSCRFDPTHE